MNLLNIHPDKNQRWILLSLFLSGLLITYVHPMIVKVVAGIVCIAGFAAALLFMPSLKTALVLWGLCCVIDDLGWIVVYVRNRDTLRNID